MSLKDKLKEITERACKEQNLHLVELSVKGDFRRPVFQIFVDNEKGITLGECEKLSRHIQDELDMDDAFAMNYRIDVSSPGLDRPLAEEWEFRKNIGHNIEITLSEEGISKKITGKLVSIEDGFIELETEMEKLNLRIESIEKAKVKIQW